MIWELFNAVMQHPFWALYITILLGIAIHGFRPINRNNDLANQDNNSNNN